jgi:hypothetical protein
MVIIVSSQSHREWLITLGDEVELIWPLVLLTFGANFADLDGTG